MSIYHPNSDRVSGSRPPNGASHAAGLARAPIHARISAGGVAEWLKAPVLKTGSTPTPGETHPPARSGTCEHDAAADQAGARPHVRADWQRGGPKWQEVAACWAALPAQDRQLVARVSPELAARLEQLTDGPHTGGP